MPSRREMLKRLTGLMALLFFGCRAKKEEVMKTSGTGGISARVFRAVNGSPGENMEKVVEMMGGIDALIGLDDIVILKPNLQWFNHGAPNIAAVNSLVEMIMGMRNGFRGQVILMENIHYGPKPWELAGWARPFARNSDLPGISNYNELAAVLKKKYDNNFSVCHLIDVKSGGKRVFSPTDGPGYVLCDGAHDVPLLSMDNGLTGKNRREVLMTYPIIRTDRGTLVDYRHGVWENGAYTNQPVKLINIAALNHHSSYCGMTSAVKNFLGVSDLSGGPDPHENGRIIGHYYNFHSFPFDKWKKGPVPGMLGAVVGFFLKMIRRPFLNITTAEYCGLVDRTHPPVAHTKAVAASTDPVALDHHMAKYVLRPNSRIRLHNPEHRRSPTAQYLGYCAQYGEYCFDENQVQVQSYDLMRKAFQGENELTVRGEKEWGRDTKLLMKYSLLRSGVTS